MVAALRHLSVAEDAPDGPADARDAQRVRLGPATGLALLELGPGRRTTVVVGLGVDRREVGRGFARPSRSIVGLT